MKDEASYPLQQETHTIIGVCMEVHRVLGPGLLEVVYKDAIEYEFKMKKIPYEREKEYPVYYKDTILPRKFNTDFVVYGSVVLEVKAQKNLIEENYKQTINYLALSKCKVGLVVNFGESSLKFRRIIF